MRLYHPRVVDLTERPDLAGEFARIGRDVWPRFVYEEPTGAVFLPHMSSAFPDFQLLALTEDESAAVGCARGVAFSWDGNQHTLPDGWAATLRQAFGDRSAGITPSALSAISAFVATESQGSGLGTLLLEALARAAVKHGLEHFVAPVRPTAKERYPLIPMDRYIEWRCPSGEPFDPWIRSHSRIGGTVVSVCSTSMEVSATVAEWEEWIQMPIPDSGSYLVPGGLVPLSVDRTRGIATYTEPNVWMVHTLERFR